MTKIILPDGRVGAYKRRDWWIFPNPSIDTALSNEDAATMDALVAEVRRLKKGWLDEVRGQRLYPEGLALEFIGTNPHVTITEDESNGNS